ncbi:hypothetical protein QUC31_013089 [Theobroma cacao]
MWVKALVCLLSHLLIGMSLATALRCYDTGNFTTNSTYGINRDLILASLPANVSANGGFFTATIGKEPNKVYALGLCRGDSTSENCFSSLNSTTQDLIAKCPNQKEAISWGGDPPSMVRYANRSFFGILELDPSEAGTNVNDIKSNLTQFNTVWESLMDSVVRNASMGSFRLKYSTGEADNTVFQKIHALMQCTPDLSQSDCDSCLRESVSDYQRMFYGKQGGYVQRPNCWFRWDLYPFYVSNATTTAPSLSPPPPPTNTTITKEDGGISSQTVVIIVVPIMVLVAVVLIASVILLKRRKPKQENENEKSAADEKRCEESFQFDFNAIGVATDDFSPATQIGKGGFGFVYKVIRHLGKLPDGQVVAVKRLSGNSGQGEQEFKNEVLLMVKLQHKNLVRLLGFSLEKKERIIIYEFVPNSSLDNFIFGMVAITFDGYMAPEYARKGHFSVKSDVYSFGVLVLEIVSGKSINGFRDEETGVSLITHVSKTGILPALPSLVFGALGPSCYVHIVKSLQAWKNWNEGTPWKLIDDILLDDSRSEMLRCIHLGLLCVQENIAHRPTMDSVVLMLSSSSISLRAPSRPAFLLQSSKVPEGRPESSRSSQSKSAEVQVTVNEASFSELDPR